ncbi:MAG: hypothetical protein P4L40_10175 [Terracidiphilus sp.]|nr:hypothetical protein [Terracidiphilus sp.]
MSEEKAVTRHIADQKNLPALYPTHAHPPQFWEHLGRTVATFGFLEEVLRKATFAFTGMRKYSDQEIMGAYEAWLPKLEKTLTDPLCNLADSYRKAVREYPNSNIRNVDQLVDEIKKASEIRNILCHASWRPPDAEGKSLPFFANRKKEIVETNIGVDFLGQVQAHVATLARDVVDTVEQNGWQFPGSSGPGEIVWPGRHQRS